MKSLLTLAVMLATACALPAQNTNPPTFIKGDLAIKYNTRMSPGNPAVKDVYTLNLNVNNSAGFHGTITDTPLVMSGMITKTVSRSRSLYYDLSCDVMNPKTGQVVGKNISRLYGTVPIDLSGVYNYNSGSLEFSVLDRRAGSDSKFSGTAAGKPLNRPADWLDKVKLQTVTITRQINGKTQKVILKKYDKMEFQNVLLAAGPIPMYQTATATGEMYYDYDKFEWFFKDITIQYSVPAANGDGSVIRSDRLTGTIRWMPDAHRATTGQGDYQFDIRVNEPIPNEMQSSAAPASDESAFTEVDNSVPSLTGTMSYRDTFKQGTVDAVGDPLGNNATTLTSAVTIDLNGNGITKQQIMVLCKMVVFAAVVPMNSD